MNCGRREERQGNRCCTVVGGEDHSHSERCSHQCLTHAYPLCFQEVQQMYPTVRLTAFIHKRFDEHYRKLRIEFNKREEERRLVEERSQEKVERLERLTQEAAARQREGVEAQQEEELPEVSMDHRLLYGMC